MHNYLATDTETLAGIPVSALGGPFYLFADSKLSWINANAFRFFLWYTLRYLGIILKNHGFVALRRSCIP